jgi:hypothetical protein
MVNLVIERTNSIDDYAPFLHMCSVTRLVIMRRENEAPKGKGERERERKTINMSVCLLPS